MTSEAYSVRRNAKHGIAPTIDQAVALAKYSNVSIMGVSVAESIERALTGTSSASFALRALVFVNFDGIFCEVRFWRQWPAGEKAR